MSAQPKPIVVKVSSKPRFADDLLVMAICHLLRHEETGQTEQEHVVSESILTCVEALCQHFEEQSPDTPSEEIQFRAGQILRLLEISAERGESVHELMTATELESDDVLLAIRYLQNCGARIRSEIAYESRYLELVFLLELHQVRGMR